MSTPARRRLMRDFKRLQTDPPAGISGAPQENDILKWHAVIFGYAYILSFIVRQHYMDVVRYTVIHMTHTIFFNYSPEDTPWEGGKYFHCHNCSISR